MRLNPAVLEEAARRALQIANRHIVGPHEWEQLLHAAAYDLELPFYVPDAEPNEP